MRKPQGFENVSTLQAIEVSEGLPLIGKSVTDHQYNGLNVKTIKRNEDIRKIFTIRHLNF